MDTLFRIPQPTRPARRRSRSAPGRPLAAEPPHPAAAPTASAARGARRETATQVVALLLDPLPIWLAQRRDPTLARTPTATVQDGKVVHANPSARRLGVSRGMRVEGAHLRAEHLVTLTPNEVETAHAWDGVLRDLAAWTPWLVGRRRGLALLRATTREAADLAAAFEGRVGVAADRQTAELAAAAAHPGAVRTVAPGEEAAFLERLPLRFLRAVGLPDRDLTRLHWLGLATAGDLAAWSREQLEGYLGESGRALLPYLHGPRDGALPTWVPPEPLRRRLAFERPLFEPFELEGAIDHLSHALAGALGGTAARRLTLVADVGGVAMPASRAPKRPLHEAGQIRRQALLALSDCGAAPIGIDGLTLELDERRRVSDQEGLWATRAQRERASDAVQGRFPGTLRRVRWGDPYAPAADHAWDWVPVEEDAPERPPAPALQAGTDHAAVPLFAALGREHPEAIVLGPSPTAGHAAPPRTAPARTAPAPRPVDAPPIDLATLEVERAERWPGERSRLTGRILRAA
jgi:protein ImuB